MKQDSFVQGNKFAVVTGASSGIGLELAREFAKHDFDLLICSEEGAIVTAAHELSDLGVKVDHIQVDLSTYDGVEALYLQIQRSGRAVDAIAINAGVGVGGYFADDTSLSAELKMIDLNVKSTVHLAKRIISDMKREGKGRILFTSSLVSQMPGPFEAVYAATKAFVESFVQAIRAELKDTEIVITSLLPGATETNFFHRAGMDDTKVGQAKKDDPAEVAKDGFDALMKGEDHVVAGSFKNKLFEVMGKILPDDVSTKLHEDMAKPGSAEKH